MAADPSDLVAVGAIGAPVGVRGDVTIVSWTDDPALRFAPGTVLLTEPADAGPLTVESSRSQGTRLVVHFAGLDDRDTIESIRRTQLFVPAASRPPLTDPEDFYDTDLVGLRAVDPAGVDLGEVVGVEHGVGGDRLVVRVPAGPSEAADHSDTPGCSDAAGRSNPPGRWSASDHLVPFVAAIVPTVDVAGGRVVIDAPEGLFDL